MNTVLNHFKLSIKNKQCFMCKHFSDEKCTLNKTYYPFNWEKYYTLHKHPNTTLSVCKGNDFKAGGKNYILYKNLLKEIN